MSTPRESTGFKPELKSEYQMPVSAVTNKIPININYKIKQILGFGAFSQVHLAESVLNPGQYFAVKIISKKLIKHNELANELNLLKLAFGGNQNNAKREPFFSHPNIVQLLEIYESASNVYLVMELATGGELYDRIIKKGSFTEKYAANIIRQVLMAVDYMHENGVVHRDLKPENILFCNREEDSKIMITDFGLSKILKYSDETMRTICGSSYYIAPEIVSAKKPYGKAVDIWSIGVITYILLCGCPPFYDDHDKILLKKIVKGDYEFDPKYWGEISESAKDFIRNLMCVNVEKRYNCKEALAHSWLRIDINNIKASNKNLYDSVSEQLKINFPKSKWKQVYNATTIVNHLQNMLTLNQNISDDQKLQ